MIPASRLRPDKPVANIIDCFWPILNKHFTLKEPLEESDLGDKHLVFSTTFHFCVLEMFGRQTFCKIQDMLFFNLPTLTRQRTSSKIP